MENIWGDNDLIEGFQIHKQVEFKLQYEFDQDAFIRFMMIQSNVNCQIENHTKKIEEVRKWFEKGLETIFKSGNKTLVFEGYSWYIKLKKY